MPDHLPGPGEDSFLLLGENAGVGVKRRGNRPGVRNVGIDLNRRSFEHAAIFYVRRQRMAVRPSDIGLRTSDLRLSEHRIPAHGAGIADGGHLAYSFVEVCKRSTAKQAKPSRDPRREIRCLRVRPLKSDARLLLPAGIVVRVYVVDLKWR